MPKQKTKKDSPFRNYSVADILATEATTYFIVAGNDVFAPEGRFNYTWLGAVRMYNKLLAGLVYNLKHGSEEEMAEAKMLLENLRIERLMVH